MKKKILLILSIILLFFGLSSCKKNENKEIDNRITEGTIEERLNKLDRIKDVQFVTKTDDFSYIFSFNFTQYIDHDNKELGTFNQKCEFGFNGFDDVNVLVTEGYFVYDYNYEYSTGENELAFLLNGNYLYVEHRYFGESLPVELDYYNLSTWDYLTTKQAADDLHEIYVEMKRILDGKWIATGASKGGMTTQLYAYYHPGDMNLYVPYVGAFSNSFEDTRYVK